MNYSKTLIDKELWGFSMGCFIYGFPPLNDKIVEVAEYSSNFRNAFAFLYCWYDKPISWSEKRTNSS